MGAVPQPAVSAAEDMQEHAGEAGFQRTYRCPEREVMCSG